MLADDRPQDRRATAVALLVAGAFFMENLDGTVIATALPAMARSFDSTPSALSIGMTAYLLTLAVFIPASGWIADRYGPRPVFATAVALFTLASIACALSNSLLAFTLARILQGGAGALMVPVGRLVVLRDTEKKDLLKAIAILTWPALVAPIIGPPVGGFITGALSWRWIFFINVPFGVAGCVLAVLLIGDEGGDDRRPFDTVGFVLNGVSLGLLLFALDRFGQAEADQGVAAVVLAASLALGALATRHALTSPHPLVSFDAFRVHSFMVTMRGGSIARIVISTMPFLLPLLFQVALGMGPAEAGLYVLWYGLANLAIKPATSGILRRFGFRNVLIVNTVIHAAAIASCALIGPHTPLIATAALLMLAGASRSMQFTAMNSLSFAEMPAAQTSAANTLFNVAFQLGLGLGIAAAAILLRLLETLLAGQGAPPTLPFHAAFILVGLAGLLPLLDFLALAPNAGSSVSGRTV